jgi:hypothetical protein
VFCIVKVSFIVSELVFEESKASKGQIDLRQLLTVAGESRVVVMAPVLLVAFLDLYLTNDRE